MAPCSVTVLSLLSLPKEHVARSTTATNKCVILNGCFFLSCIMFLSRRAARPNVTLPVERCLRQNNKLHLHTFMVITADDGAKNFIFAWLRGSVQRKCLDAGFQFKVPSGNLGVIFCAQQRKPMHRAVAAPCFAFARLNVQHQRLAGLYGNLVFFLTGQLEMAVFIGQNLNHMWLCPCWN